MDYSLVLSYVVEIVEYCIPFSLIFGIVAKMCNFALDMVFNKKIDLQEENMSLKVVLIIGAVMLVIGLASHVLAYFMEKRYKSKMNTVSKK